MNYPESWVSFGSTDRFGRLQVADGSGTGQDSGGSLSTAIHYYRCCLMAPVHFWFWPLFHLLLLLFFRSSQHHLLTGYCRYVPVLFRLHFRHRHRRRCRFIATEARICPTRSLYIGSKCKCQLFESKQWAFYDYAANTATNSRVSVQ